MSSYIFDKDTDKQIASINLTLYTQIRENRQARLEGSNASHMASWSEPIPKPTLNSLQERIQKYQSKIDNSYNIIGADLIIQHLQTIINEGNYSAEGTPEYDKRIQWETLANSFVWPDANELAIRQQEEAELMALLG